MQRMVRFDHPFPYPFLWSFMECVPRRWKNGSKLNLVRFSPLVQLKHPSKVSKFQSFSANTTSRSLRRACNLDMQEPGCRSKRMLSYRCLERLSSVFSART